MLLVIIPAIPFIGALVLLLAGKRTRIINIPFIASLLVLILGGFGLRNISGGGSLTFMIPFSGPFAPVFHMDNLSAVFVMVTALLWLAVSVYTPFYMKHEGKTWGFDLCTLLTQTAVLGIFLAGDLFTMLLFFEIMTIASYFWVVHKWNKEAIRAGYFYLFYSIVGGLFIALGIVLMGAAASELPYIGAGSAAVLNPNMFAISIIIFVIGFGIKAGIVPLHLWLPHAHSAAPTPGSALLSGLLIKVGAYGLIRVGEFVGWGKNTGMGVIWLGPVLAVIGTCTMLTGVVAALLQSNAKRLLAYHSVSQMGYIILGLGIGLYLGADGSLGTLGAVYHIVNHALFKSVLFMGVGAVYIQTKEMNLYKLGGLWRRLPVTAALMLLAVFGITGAPGLNGYASKTLLHHAVSQAAETGKLWAVWAERLFLFVGVGTAASFTKLYYLMFLRKTAEIKVTGSKSVRPHLSMGILTVVMLGIGLAPAFLVNNALVPAVGELGIEKAAFSIVNLSFWNLSDVIGMLITLILGIFVCWIGLRSGVFHWHPPAWLTIEGLAKIVFLGFSNICRAVTKLGRYLISFAGNAGKAIKIRMYPVLCRFDKSRSGSIGWVTLTGISADAAILIIVLIVLIVWYTITNPEPAGVKLFYF